MFTEQSSSVGLFSISRLGAVPWKAAKGIHRLGALKSRRGRAEFIQERSLLVLDSNNVPLEHVATLELTIRVTSREFGAFLEAEAKNITSVCLNAFLFSISSNI